MLGAALRWSVVLMRIGQAPYNLDFTQFMTDKPDLLTWLAGHASLSLEEHVRYSEVGKESFDPCDMPLFPANANPRAGAGCQQ